MARDNLLTIRLSDEERAALAEAARREDVPVAQLARRAIKRELERIQPATHSSRGDQEGKRS